jgi:hypothetical protein
MLLNEIMEKTDKLNKVVGEIKLPIFVIHSEADKIADYSSTKKFYEQVGGKIRFHVEICRFQVKIKLSSLLKSIFTIYITNWKIKKLLILLFLG